MAAGVLLPGTKAMAAAAAEEVEAVDLTILKEADDSMKNTRPYLASVLGVQKPGTSAAPDAGFAPDSTQNASFGSWNVDMYAV